MKLYTLERWYKGGISIVAASREEASRIVAEAKLQGSYDDEVISVDPEAWTETDFGKPVLFRGDV
jgi:hypothetical protein